ncbi:hypothetical protein GALMADRAFT_206184 [Galerina marginata CBS 339.88]|uniref:Uncharacterized protein n=1 Tax=Galerina marginata (strain CBS 339.88) TaxID=685588 RepID=A0A067TN55_GALM3|nr:hypothetical protein GALMADRAFT_206184 [Galerina marginata CBS 339.88]
MSELLWSPTLLLFLRLLLPLRLLRFLFLFRFGLRKSLQLPAAQRAAGSIQRPSYGVLGHVCGADDGADDELAILLWHLKRNGDDNGLDIDGFDCKDQRRAIEDGRVGRNSERGLNRGSSQAKISSHPGAWMHGEFEESLSFLKWLFEENFELRMVVRPPDCRQKTDLLQMLLNSRPLNHVNQTPNSRLSKLDGSRYRSAVVVHVMEMKLRCDARAAWTVN